MESEILSIFQNSPKRSSKKISIRFLNLSDGSNTLSFQKIVGNIDPTLISWAGSQSREFSHRMAGIEKAYEDGHYRSSGIT